MVNFFQWQIDWHMLNKLFQELSHTFFHLQMVALYYLRTWIIALLGTSFGHVLFMNIRLSLLLRGMYICKSVTSSGLAFRDLCIAIKNFFKKIQLGTSHLRTLGRLTSSKYISFLKLANKKNPLPILRFGQRSNLYTRKFYRRCNGSLAKILLLISGILISLALLWSTYQNASQLSGKIFDYWNKSWALPSRRLL